MFTANPPAGANQSRYQRQEMNMRAYNFRRLGHAVNMREIGHSSGPTFQVAVDGWLVGCYTAIDTAVFEALEKIRQLTGWGNAVTLRKTRRASILAWGEKMAQNWNN